jgi:two-component system, cell cycle sensor histidine kinase and response regulator CckA
MDSAVDGIDAFNKIMENDYEFIFTDIMLPGKTGIQIYSEAIERKPDLKFMFTTGYLIRDEWLPIFENSFGVLQKPFSPEDVLQSFQKVFPKQSV